MGDDTSSAVELALLKERLGRTDDRLGTVVNTLEKMADGFRRATASPPTVEFHDGAVHAACTTCGTERTVSIPEAPAASRTFDDVLSDLDRPHNEAGGKGVLECPSCRPKLEAKLASMGFNRAASKPADSD